MTRLLLLLMLWMPVAASAGEVGGVSVVDSLVLDGTTLKLNGAGIRTKFFFDIYVGALYRTTATRDATAVLDHPAPAVVSMTFLYKSVDAGKLRDGWQEGFRKNQSDAAMQVLQARLEKFDAMFGESRRGDRYRFDFRTDGSTSVSFNGKKVGSIPGKDFQRALLAVWLGSKPADDDLKEAMLGGE